MTTQPRIAICMEYPLGQTGGVEVLVRAFLEALASEFEVVLVSDDDEASLAPWSKFIVAHIPWRFGEGSPKRVEVLVNRLAELRVQVAHFHFGGPFAWNIRNLRSSPLRQARRRSIPCLMTNHWVRPALEGYCGECRPAWLKLALWPYAWLARAQNLRAATGEITVSKADCQQERSNLVFWPDKIKSIYHSTLDENEPFSEEPRVPTILCLGTMARRKGQDVLLQAFHGLTARFPEWKLLLIGRTTAEWESMMPAREIGAQIEMAGEIRDPQQIRILMQQASIFVMPSRSEGLGLSLQEALFRGCACIGSCIGGIPELIEHGKNGWLVPSNNVPALASALERMMSDPFLRQKLSRAGRASVLDKGMTRQRMIDTHRQMYLDLLKSRL